VTAKKTPAYVLSEQAGGFTSASFAWSTCMLAVFTAPFNRMTLA
jgi:hypothetical protein